MIESSVAEIFPSPVAPVAAPRPLRCLFLITSMPVGGAETLLVNLLRRLDRAWIVPEVACLKTPGPLGETIAGEIPVHSGLLSCKWDVRVLARLCRLIRRRRIDAVVTVGAGDKMFWGRLAARLARVPVIVSALHSTGWPDGVGRLNRALTPITDGFIAVADSHADYLRVHEGFPAARVHVIRNGVDCERFRPDPTASARVRRELGIPDNAPVAGIVAALRPEKNHQMLLRVAAELRPRHPRLRWLIVGDGPERSMLRSVTSRLGLADRVHFLGTRHDTPRLLPALDLFVLGSLNEASPVSILEAAACGLPVVATDVGSVAETVADGVTGYLVPARDDSAMAGAIERLLFDPEARRRMGDAGRAAVKADASLDAMVRGYETLLHALYADKAH